MLKDCLEVFKKQYEAKGEGYILDDYVLLEGNYFLIDSKGNCKLSLDVSKKDKETDVRDRTYRLFSQMDYLSKLADMNKAIGIKKVIHSNNYLSFFIKKDNLSSGKLTEEVIDRYYDVLINPATKYAKDKKSMEIYQAFEDEYGKPDLQAIEENKAWIKQHIPHIVEEYPEIKQDKNYLKIFFEKDIERFEIESKRYFLPNIYNSTEYNVTLNEQVFGMPNDNLGLNSKKPYLKHRTRKNDTPYLINTEEVLLQKKFFDFLMNKASQGYSNIYIDEDIHCLPPDQSMPKRFSGYFLRIQKGKEVEIKEFDTIACLDGEIEPCIIPKSIEIDYAKLKCESEFRPKVITQLDELKKMINSVLFSKWLANSYFREAADIKLNDIVLKRNILESRDAFFAWFYKGNETIIKPLFPTISMSIIKNTICNGYRIRAQEQWMLREGVMNYLNRGGVQMADSMKEKLDELEVRMNADKQQRIESDVEYAIAAGQLVNFFLSLNKASTPKHALINPILNIKSDGKLKEELNKLFKKYNYTIERRSKRFGNLYAMILAYTPVEKINQEALLYGYLTNSLIYKKGEKENE